MEKKYKLCDINSKTQGFLRRSLDYVKWREALKDESESAQLNATIDFMLTFIEEPADRDEARRLLIDDLSQEEYQELLSAITGAPNPTP